MTNRRAFEGLTQNAGKEHHILKLNIVWVEHGPNKLVRPLRQWVQFWEPFIFGFLVSHVA